MPKVKKSAYLSRLQRGSELKCLKLWKLETCWSGAEIPIYRGNLKLNGEGPCFSVSIVYRLTKKPGFAKDYGLKKQIQDAAG